MILHSIFIAKVQIIVFRSTPYAKFLRSHLPLNEKLTLAGSKVSMFIDLFDNVVYPSLVATITLKFKVSSRISHCTLILVFF